MRASPRLRVSIMELLKDGGAGRPYPATYDESLIRVRDSVVENLNWLLNSRRPWQTVPEECEESVGSLLSYGLPDIAAFCVTGDADRLRLGAAVRVAIERFEPRLMDVTVEAEPWEEAEPRGLVRYTIRGWMKSEPEPDSVEFETLFEASSLHFTVKDH